MDEMGGWTVSDHLLATIADRLGVVAYNALVGPHADPKKLRRAKPPKPVTRPSVPHHRHRPRRRATSDDLKAIFGGGSVAYSPKGVD